jgi:RimJ/RimL family protein N-acetyltransferase
VTRRLIGNDNARALMWAAYNFPGVFDPGPYPFTSLIDEREGKIIAAAFYNERRNHSIMVHGCANLPNWLRRDSLKAFFGYPFQQLGTRRLGTTIPEKNEASICFALHLGFRIEGRLRKANLDGSDLLHLGILREECKYLGEMPALEPPDVLQQP